MSGAQVTRHPLITPITENCVGIKDYRKNLHLEKNIGLFIAGDRDIQVTFGILPITGRLKTALQDQKCMRCP